jgi:hypothetical protein
MTTVQLSELIRGAFPAEPLPGRFWADGIDSIATDIPKELGERIADRPWGDVTMLDWSMTGVHASIARNYFDADAFRYYLPSLLIGGLTDFGYIDWPLECLLPAGRKRRTSGEWWQKFSTGFSNEQKVAVRAYLIGVRAMLRDATHLSEIHLIDEARAIWGS